MEDVMSKPQSQAVVFLTLLMAFAVTSQSAWAQPATYTPPPHFSHIVIIVQENRSPDTLFGGAPIVSSPVCGGFNGFKPSVDLANGGANNYSGLMMCSPLTEVTDLNTGGGSHSNEDWQGQWDNGLMDGACNPITDPNVDCGETTGPPNKPYTYVVQSVIQPYLDIANDYGWANYMFQTNEGPSYPAHQFLFGGTSAPVWPTDMYANYFVADNAGFSNTGCNEQFPNVPWVDPTGDPSFNYPTPTTLGASPYTCYDRNTLVTVQDSAGNVSDRIDKSGHGVTWAYYAQSPGIIWDAPESVTQTCYSQAQAPAGNPACSGPEYNHVRFPGTMDGQSAPILTDIANCKLQKITWVTPDEVWSDHPGELPKAYTGLGPSWVADIINAIGQSSVNSGGACDYWSTEPTAIFVTWDDWGGFYDHVPPPSVARGTLTSCTSHNSNGWGCGYTYGFRVPLLVVSPFTKAGTVSGPLVPAVAFPPKYPPPAQWIHDFGSILAFTEQNFYPAGTQIAPAGYTYADSNSFDVTFNGQTVVPLWEFFNNGSMRTFTPISAPYNASFFENYYNTDGPDGMRHFPQGPDKDDDDE
jgi:phospholipase C